MPSICLPVSRQRTIVQIGQNLCFQSVNLANEADFFNKEIDLLIGADFNYKLVKRDTKKKKIKDVRLFAIKSIYGWRLNVPISKSYEINSSSVNLIQSSHVLNVLRDVKNKDFFTRNLHRF